MTLKRTLLVVALAAPATGALDYCGGEYSLCDDGSCALTNSSCGVCAAGEYACPLTTTCLSSLDDYATNCDGLTGTHLDWTMSEDDRLAYLNSVVDVSDMILQLVNDAPQIDSIALPAYNWLNDNEHGVKGTANATVYPMGVGMGASFSKDLAYEVGQAIGIESRSTHNAQADKSGNSCGSTSTGEIVANGCGITLYAPNINLVRDPRWGRAEEVYGEDPHLTAELAVGMITGMQGNEEGEITAKDGQPLMSGASCKHFAVYQNEDQPEARTTLDANVTARDLWETYMPVMKACVTRAKATHVMCSYNAVNGKPTCAHPELLNGILRDAWGFDGFVVSDYDAWVNLVTTHHYVDTYGEAATVGLNAGMDQEGGFGTYSVIDAMPEALAVGNITEQAITNAFTRLMRIRLRLGMFDPPAQVDAMDNTKFNPDLQCETEEKLELARKAAREGVVLLKNEDSTLPLSKTDFTSTSSLALVGPQSDDWRVLLGAVNYAFEDGPSKGCKTVLDGLTDALSSDVINQVDGCDTVACDEASTMTEAAAAAADADATVVILGNWWGTTTGWPLCSGDGTDGCESESHDRTVIELPGQQVELVQALRDATTNPLVCVLIHGGAVALGDANDACDAIVDLWVPGQMGGTALADILFGDASPAGRSPITFYGATTDLPAMAEFDEYPHESSNGTTYRYYEGAAPTYKFGHGLSYTTFAYSDLALSGTKAPCDDLTVTVTVTNTGDMASDEVVQVYVKTPDSTVPSPQIRLAAFDRLTNIAPGESRTVELTLTPESHAVVYPNADSVYVEQTAVESGALEVYVGGAQPDDDGTNGVLSASVSISDTTMLKAC